MSGRLVIRWTLNSKNFGKENYTIVEEIVGTKDASWNNVTDLRHYCCSANFFLKVPDFQQSTQWTTMVYHFLSSDPSNQSSLSGKIVDVRIHMQARDHSVQGLVFRGPSRTIVYWTTQLALLPCIRWITICPWITLFTFWATDGGPISFINEATARERSSEKSGIWSPEL